MLIPLSSYDQTRCTGDEPLNLDARCKNQKSSSCFTDDEGYGTPKESTGETDLEAIYNARSRLHFQPASPPGSTTDDRSPDEQKQDAELAERLSTIIEDANERVVPLCDMIRKNIENMKARPEEDRNEDELVEQVKPLLEQAEKILNETLGAVKGADPDNRLSNKAKRHQQDHKATPEEQRLAEALKVLAEKVQGTIDWAKDELDAFPKAKNDLGPLLDALGQPVIQIVGGVGMLLSGVLNLLGNLLSGLGLDSLLKGVVGAFGLDKVFAGMGLSGWIKKK